MFQPNYRYNPFYPWPCSETIHFIDKDECYVYAPTEPTEKIAEMLKTNNRNTYILRTRDPVTRRPLFLKEIKEEVKKFIEFAKANPNISFLVTKIGYDVAGYKEIDIAPLFRECLTISNIHLPCLYFDYLANKQ